MVVGIFPNQAAISPAPHGNALPGGEHRPRRRPLARAERRMGRPTRPLHDTSEHRPHRRCCRRQPARHDRPTNNRPMPESVPAECQRHHLQGHDLRGKSSPIPTLLSTAGRRPAGVAVEGASSMAGDDAGKGPREPLAVGSTRPLTGCSCDGCGHTGPEDVDAHNGLCGVDGGVPGLLLGPGRRPLDAAPGLRLCRPRAGRSLVLVRRRLEARDPADLRRPALELSRRGPGRGAACGCRGRRRGW